MSQQRVCWRRAARQGGDWEYQATLSGGEAQHELLAQRQGVIRAARREPLMRVCGTDDVGRLEAEAMYPLTDGRIPACPSLVTTGVCGTSGEGRDDRWLGCSDG
ncbi:hypothetical protein ACOMHN_015123 [Nucella lapillus]